MLVRSPKFRRAALTGAVTLCAALTVTLSLTAAVKRPIKKLTFDPAAPSVELFEGIDSGDLESTVVMKGPFEGTVYLENKTDKPLTVQIPKAVAAVHVLKQGFGGGGPGGGMGGGMGGMGGGMGGQGQSMGGGMGGMGGMGGGGMGGMGGGGGGGFFSIPPEKTVQVPLTTVCMNHGKPDPKPKMTYKLIPLDSLTNDPVLQQVVTMVATGRMDSASAQAATWHLTDNMSWEELAAKKIRHVGGVPPEPYFTGAQLASARQIVVQAQARVRENAHEAPSTEAPKVRNRRPEKKS